MATSMDDILSEKPAEREPTPEKPEKPEAAADAPEKPERPEKPEAERPTSKRKDHQKREWEAQGRDPNTGQFVKKDEQAPPAEKPEAKAAEKPAEKPEAKAPEKPAEPAKQEMTDRERAAFAKAADETRKRQALEQRLAALEGKQTEKSTEPPKSFWDDPEGWKKRFDAEQQMLDANRRREALSIRLNTSETIARSRYTDFDEKIAKFGELVAATPGLAQQWLASPDPAEFAYKTGKNHLELAQAGSLDKLKAEIETRARAEERAKVEAEYKAKEEEAARKRAELPGTLSDVRGAASRQNLPVFSGPTPMADILKH